MGLFSKKQTEPLLIPGDDELPINGESHYQDALAKICGGRDQMSANQECVAILVPDPANLYDSNAVRVEINGLLVGHLSRTSAARLQPSIVKLTKRQPVAVRARIRGGWDRGAGNEGSFGVLLFADWTVLGA